MWIQMNDKKELSIDTGELENDEFRRCRQTQCGFFLNGGCRECRECNAKSFLIRKSCACCDNCENQPGYLRFGDEDMQKEMEAAAAQFNKPQGVILVYGNKASPEHIRQEEELMR